MKYIILLFGTPLGFLMHFCYDISPNYGTALILFTLISKIILFPISLIAHVNAVRMAKIKPRLDEIKRHYSGVRDRIDEEQIKLYKSEKYNPFTDLMPIFIQLLMIIGLIYVMYNPLQYLLRIPNHIIELLVAKATEMSGASSLGAAAQLKTVDIIQNPANFAVFENLGLPDLTILMDKIKRININFLGVNLGMVPSVKELSPLTLVPMFSALSSLILCEVQNRIHVLQREQSLTYKRISTAFFTGFSLYFGFIVPAGIGVYWGFGNLFAILTLMLTNIIYPPGKYIDYSNRPKPIPVDKDKQRENRMREKKDYKLFFAADKKRLVFYSAKSGAYKYFQNVLEYILENSDITIHYVTGDPDDAIFGKNNPQIVPYYIGDNKLISLMTNLDTEIMVMTTPDIQKYHIKRSAVRKDIEYLYMFHSISSTHMIYREGAFNHYDTIFCIGQYHIDEIRDTERVYKMPEKRLIPCGYGLLDNLIAEYEAIGKTSDSGTVKKILVAPSWQLDNILESCLDDLLDQLIGRGYYIIVRPHPEFTKRFSGKINAIVYKYGGNSDVCIETDFSSNVTIFTADLVITDWSGIAFEYSFSTKRPCLLINTPMKIMNPNYKRINQTPVDISLREAIGVSLNMDELSNTAGAVEHLFENANKYRDKITEELNKHVFCLGHSGETGGRYILEALEHERIPLG